jgi:AcrR family transcriptional regulator
MRGEKQKPESEPEVRMRSDAQRNKDAILAAATRAFSKDADASLGGIAEAAGVGIGTLYRHYPTRELLFEAAYRNEIKTLCDLAPVLLRRLRPDRALAKFLDRFIDHMQEKPAMIQAVRALAASGGTSISESLTLVRAAIAPVIEAGRTQGVFRRDVSIEDFILIKGAIANSRPESARRLAVILIDGLRAHAPIPRPDRGGKTRKAKTGTRQSAK